MSTVGASAQAGPAAVRAAATAPPYVWMALAAVVGMAVLIWHKFGQDETDTDWLDPGQPPMNVGVDFVSIRPGGFTAVGAPPTGPRAGKPYPHGSLLQDPACWIGDC